MMGQPGTTWSRPEGPENQALTPRPLPWRGMVREFLPLMVSCRNYLSVRADIYHRYLPDPARLEKQLRLRTMFLAGGMAGALASRYLHGGAGGWRRRALTASLFSLWANYLILADAASDLRELGQEASEVFLTQCLKTILGPLLRGEERLLELAPGFPGHPGKADQVGLEAGAGTPLARAALCLAARFGDAAAACLRLGEDEAD